MPCHDVYKTLNKLFSSIDLGLAFIWRGLSLIEEESEWNLVP